MECPDAVELVDLEVLRMDELLVCYGGQAIRLEVSGISDVDIDGPCPWAATDEPCTLEPDWMAADVQIYRDFGGAPTDTGTAIFSPYLAIHPDVAGHRDDLPDSPVVATLMIDHPNARTCRIVNDEGKNLVDPWIAELHCRLQPVLVAAEPAAP